MGISYALIILIFFVHFWIIILIVFVVECVMGKQQVVSVKPGIRPLCSSMGISYALFNLIFFVHCVVVLHNLFHAHVHV
jgi:hypothetical protein